MSAIRKTLENREQAETALKASDVSSVRIGRYDADKKRVFWLVSATKFPQGFTLRLDRKAFAKKLDANTAFDTMVAKLDNVLADRKIDANLTRFETWTDADRATRLVSKTVAPKVVTLDRAAASELLGITRGALGKRIKRAGGVYKLENGQTVS